MIPSISPSPFPLPLHLGKASRIEIASSQLHFPLLSPTSYPSRFQLITSPLRSRPSFEPRASGGSEGRKSERVKSRPDLVWLNFSATRPGALPLPLSLSLSRSFGTTFFFSAIVSSPTSPVLPLFSIKSETKRAGKQKDGAGALSRCSSSPSLDHDASTFSSLLFPSLSLSLPLTFNYNKPPSPPSPKPQPTLFQKSCFVLPPLPFSGLRLVRQSSRDLSSFRFVFFQPILSLFLSSLPR